MRKLSEHALSAASDYATSRFPVGFPKKIGVWIGSKPVLKRKTEHAARISMFELMGKPVLRGRTTLVERFFRRLKVDQFLILQIFRPQKMTLFSGGRHS